MCTGTNNTQPAPGSLGYLEKTMTFDDLLIPCVIVLFVAIGGYVRRRAARQHK
jgi:hypothetical protein